MPGHNPFDMDFDGDVDGIDFLGFDYLVRHVLGYGSEEEDSKEEEDEYESEDEDSDVTTHHGRWQRLI